jgi:integrase
MSLEIQHGRKPYWYARLRINGVTVCHTLNAKVEGVVPKPLSKQSDVAFEVCRARAQAEHDELAAEARQQRRGEQWLEKLYEAKTGEPVPSILLTDMFSQWDGLDAKRAPRYVSQVKAMHEQFIEFMATNYPNVREMSDVRENMAKEFMATIEAFGYAPGTFNNKLDMLCSTFNALGAAAGVSQNPFAGIEEHPTNIINRIPFTEAELERILAVAERPQHAAIFPALVTASMTAMRRADCCLLKKTVIDRTDGKITVRTSKTGKTIKIPIAPKLAALLDRTPDSDSEYVFPELARRFLRNPDSITDMTRSVLKQAGFFNPQSTGPKPTGPIQAKREKGKGVRVASTRDFHSFRATWVTIAILSGVPIEMVCLVTGHTSPETLRRHYFLPGFEEFRQVLEAKLPQVLGGDRQRFSVTPETLEKVYQKITRMSAKNWARCRGEVLALISPTS